MTLEDIQKKYGVEPLEKGYAKAFISSLKKDLGQNDADLFSLKKKKFEKYATPEAKNKHVERMISNLPERGTKFTNVNFAITDARDAVQKLIAEAEKSGYAGIKAKATKIKADIVALMGLLRKEGAMNNKKVG